ncbi:hypothetical protein ABZ738_30595 [Micromonospora sp. NPDC047793]|uniref:hypothetical protein n=1 Tax=Micromonospora sp. NPDC047793 TaxID=3154342 RepID=UPI0033C49ADB
MTRGDQRREAIVAGRLDALQSEVQAATPDQREQARQRLLPGWQIRLADLLEENPDLAEAIQQLRDELRPQLPVVQQQWVQNVTATAGGATAQGAMFGNIINHPALTPPRSTPNGQGPDGGRSDQ